MLFTAADDDLRLWWNVSRFLVALHAAVKDAVDAIGLGEDGRIADTEAHAQEKTEHWKIDKQKKLRRVSGVIKDSEMSWYLTNLLRMSENCSAICSNLLALHMCSNFISNVKYCDISGALITPETCFYIKRSLGNVQHNTPQSFRTSMKWLGLKN